MKNSMFVLASLFFLVSFTKAHAETAPPFEFHAYARSNFQVANGLAQGSDDLNTGWGAHNRLQEGQYFELNFDAKPLEHTFFVSTFSSGSTSYPYDNSIGSLNPTGGSWFNVRNLYLQYDNVGDGSGAFWFGARMFRGDGMYIFDTWPLDDHDMLGGGYVHKTDTCQAEFDIGTNKDSAFGVPGNSASRTGGNPTFSATTQRYIFIHKFEKKIADERKFKTNLEFQYLPKGKGTDIVTGSANNGAVFNIPSDYGVQAGVQANLWKGNTTVLNYGYGNVVGNWGSAYLNIMGKSVIGLTSVNGASITDVNAVSSKGAQAVTAALYGADDFSHWGLLYGWVPKFARTAGGNTGIVNSLGARPMYFLSQHIHVGAEVDWIVYPKRLKLDSSEVAYVEVTPILEYALAKTAYGVPKFFLAAANAFYATSVTKNSHSSRYAFDGIAGMELWF